MTRCHIKGWWGWSVPVPQLRKWVCRRVVARMVLTGNDGGSRAARWSTGVFGGVEGEGWGGTLALNIVPVQKAWGRVAVSQAATARRQDIPAQDEETSVTTCYANPRSWTRERSEGGEGRVDSKDGFSRQRSLFVCTLEAGRLVFWLMKCAAIKKIQQKKQKTSRLSVTEGFPSITGCSVWQQAGIRF